MLLFSDGFETFSPYDLWRKWGYFSFDGTNYQSTFTRHDTHQTVQDSLHGVRVSQSIDGGNGFDYHRVYKRVTLQ